MLTVSALARRCGISRSTLLYYESLGLLDRPSRTPGNYRCYTERDVRRLEEIRTYRNLGLPLRAIGEVLDRPGSGAASVLKRRLTEIDAEIETRRAHQRAILRLLRAPGMMRRSNVITKDKWVSIMRAAGFGETEMSRWHAEFEKEAPEEHQEFLEFLHIPPDEIRHIREYSRKQKA